MAVTRAQKKLHLSGVITCNQGQWGAPANSPLGWLWEHYGGAAPPAPGGRARWPGPDLEVSHHGYASEVIRQIPSIPELPEALPFTPEPLPYAMVFPSQLVGEVPDNRTETALAEEPESDIPRLRGELIHRTLETLAAGDEPPSEAALTIAIRQAGVAADLAPTLARELAAELMACRREPFLARLLESCRTQGQGMSEWLLEDRPAQGVFRRGRIDLLARDGDVWWLVDFKTSRPAAGEDWEAFMARELEKYRPQLLAYQEMVAKIKGLDPESIRPALYFTAGPRLAPLGEGVGSS